MIMESGIMGAMVCGIWGEHGEKNKIYCGLFQLLRMHNGCGKQAREKLRERLRFEVGIFHVCDKVRDGRDHKGRRQRCTYSEHGHKM